MLQAAAAFGAGLLAHERCAQAPACSANKDDGGTAFKLSVQVHSASVPALGEPGMLVRMRPRLGVGFGGVWKQTENADFIGGDIEPAHALEAYDEQWGDAVGSDAFTLSNSLLPEWRRRAGPCAMAHHQNDLAGSACRAPWAARSLAAPNETSSLGDSIAGPWRFGDTLTFSANISDVLCGGVRLKLSAHSDVVLGPMQMELPQDDEVGEAVVDLRRRVLPACSPGKCRTNAYGDDECHRVFDAWDTPVVVVPLSSVSDDPHNGIDVSVVARVAVSFSVTADPERLLREADDTEQSFPERLERMIDDFARWMQAPVTCSLGCQAGADDMETKIPHHSGYQQSATQFPRQFDEAEHDDGPPLPSVTLSRSSEPAVKL